MKVKTASLILVILFCNSKAQNIKAITDDGLEVILLSDKTWKFVNESDEQSLKTLAKNPEIFTKNSQATFLAKSKKIRSGFYFDPKKWILKPSEQGILELQVINKDGNGFGLFGTEKSSVPNYDIYKSIIIKSVSKMADFFKIIDSEIRTVNGRKILYLRYTANIQSMDFEYAGYYFIGEDGLSQLICYSSKNRFEEFYPGFIDLLNGFAAAEINTDNNLSETVQYTLPPPPITRIKQ